MSKSTSTSWYIGAWVVALIALWVAYLTGYPTTASTSVNPLTAIAWGAFRARIHNLGAARSMKAERVVLETGIHQEEAIGLYRRAGFTAVDCFDEYVGTPTSVCFEKAL